MRHTAKQIASVSIMHSLIDFLCAISLFHSRTGQPFLLYTFCAFALQLPIGIVLDEWMKRQEPSLNGAAAVTVAGVLLTVLGTVSDPIILGIGNALFHTGGGVLTIHADRREQMNGTGLGVFVAPGAIGLFLGSRLSGMPGVAVIGGTALVLAVLCVQLLQGMKHTSAAAMKPAVFDRRSLSVFAACVLVVILRSAVGFAESFAWKQGFGYSLLAVIMLAIGKSAGGLLGAVYGRSRTIAASLLAAAVCYGLKDILPFGLLALFTFNMTMPLTLYLLSQQFSDMPGFAFGALTLALFIGYVLVRVYGLTMPYFGVAGSLVSLLLLLYAEKIHAG